MAQKSRHEQQIVPKSSPGSRMVLKGLGTKLFDENKEPRGGLGKSGVGRKWSEKTQNMEKTIF